MIFLIRVTPKMIGWLLIAAVLFGLWAWLDVHRPGAPEPEPFLMKDSVKPHSHTAGGADDSQ